MAFCIPKHLAIKLKKAAVSGEFSIQSLYDAGSAGRRATFERYVSKNMAKEINTGFEKAIVSNQKDALTKWAEETFVGRKKTPEYASILKKIDSLEAKGVLDVNSDVGFLEDLVADQLGVGVTAEELQEIAKRAKKMEALAEEVTEWGNPSDAYLKAYTEMENYIKSRVPTSNVKVSTSIIGRGAMLFSIKSPVTNIAGNTVQGLFTAATKRVALGTYKGANPDLAKGYAKSIYKTYKNTGRDLTRTTSIHDATLVRGEKITHSEGKGAIRKIGRFYEDVVFGKLMSDPDVAFGAIQAGDTIDLMSTKIAKSEGLSGAALKSRAAAIFKDATSVDPKTDEGQLVREQAIADAQYATFTNDSTYSSVALGIRKLLNTATGDVRMGDQLMPFVKTPANVIGVSVDAAGLGAVKALYNLKPALQAAREGDHVPMQRVIRDATVSGLGFTLAMILANLFEPEDFIGNWPVSQKEQELLRAQNATTNSVKIGDRWISLDYFGPIAAPFVGIMYARKYGDDAPNVAYMYATGVGLQLSKIPGLREAQDVISDLSRMKRGATAEDAVLSFGEYSVDYIRSRTIPAILYDVAKSTDEYQRDTEGSALKRLQRSIPIARNYLPVRSTVTGEMLREEPFISTLLFGARIKTDTKSEVVDEMVRLDKTGNLPSLTDVAKTSSRMKRLKEQIGEEDFREANQYFKDTFGQEVNKMIKSKSYQNMPDDKKASAINSVKGNILDHTLAKYGYKRGLTE